jgi:hypothetical protein
MAAIVTSPILSSAHESERVRGIALLDVDAGYDRKSLK